MAHGGKRQGAGRKPKEQELQLIEQLSKYDDRAIDLLRKGLERGEIAYLKLFMQYRWGKPTEMKDNAPTEVVINWEESKTYTN